MLRAEGPIQTARLTVRPFGPADFDDLYDYQSRPDVARYLNRDARDRAQVREHRQGEIGFIFNSDYHGRGLATRGGRGHAPARVR